MIAALALGRIQRPLLSGLPLSQPLERSNKIRRDLGLRLSWLFENGKLPNDLRELACGWPFHIRGKPPPRSEEPVQRPRPRTRRGRGGAFIGRPLRNDRQSSLK